MKWHGFNKEKNLMLSTPANSSLEILELSYYACLMFDILLLVNAKYTVSFFS